MYKILLLKKYNEIKYEKNVWFYRINSNCHLSYSIDNMLSEITQVFTNIKNSDNLQDINDIMVANFLQDIWEMEHSTTLNRQETFDIVANLIEDTSIDTCENNTENNIICKKLLRTRNALTYLSNIEHVLSIELIKELHTIVMESDYEYAGKYRDKLVKPNTYNDVYIHYNLISKKLPILVAFWNENYVNCTTIDKLLRLTTIFFCEFLRIHPFTNGNGRVSRLLVQWMLRNVCPTPFSIYTKCPSFLQNYGSNRDIYMKIINNAQSYESSMTYYNTLATYILMACHTNAMHLAYLVSD